MKKPSRPPPWQQISRSAAADAIEYRSAPTTQAILDRAQFEYWNYDETKYHAIKAGPNAQQLWYLIKSDRTSGRKEIALASTAGRKFSYGLTAFAQMVLQRIDFTLGGSVQSPVPRLDTEDERIHYLLTSLTEEAIASSQIEGAAVTREIAKEMIRSERTPRSSSEWMILNNYRTIRFLLEKRREPLTVPLLLQIQEMLTRNTLDKPDAGGRLRRADEAINVVDEIEHEIVHAPPPAEELPGRLELLCQFANAPTDTGETATFLHPAVRAILLHFWLAYDHPFVDGNGRTARALFYWSMLRAGYWLTEYLSISRVILDSVYQYYRTFINTEVDGLDLNYFLVYHLKVIERSIREFQEYVARKRSERAQIADIIGSAQFNQRQQDMLAHALKDPATRFTIAEHASAQAVTQVTARADLLDLVERKLFLANRKSRPHHFVASPHLSRLLRKGSGRR